MIFRAWLLWSSSSAVGSDPKFEVAAQLGFTGDVAFELAPTRCAAPPPAAVPVVTVDSAVVHAIPLAGRVQAALAQESKRDQRLLVAPILGRGVRVTTSHVLAEDCVTWEPYGSPLDEPMPLPPGRYTLREFVAGVKADWWTDRATTSSKKGVIPALDVDDREVDLVAGMSLRGALEAFREAGDSAGEYLVWSWWHTNPGADTGFEPLHVLTVTAGRRTPRAPQVQWVFDPEIGMYRPENEPNWGPRGAAASAQAPPPSP